MANISDGNAFVAGRSVERVRRLLALSDELGIDQRLVQTRTGGYEVPAAVADAFEKEQADAASTKEAAPKAAPKATRTRKKKDASE